MTIMANQMPVLPVEAYTSQSWFDREMEAIFSRTWQMAGFVEDLIDPGDYITIQAGLNNILVPHLHSETLYMYAHRQQKTGFAGHHFHFFEPLSADYLDGIENNSPLPLIDHIPKDKIGAYVPMLFPNLGLSETESSWSTFYVIPVAPEKSIVELRTKVMPVSDWQFMAQEWKSWNFFKNFKGDKYRTGNPDDPLASGDFMAEDIYVCEQQQRSFKSPYFSVGAIAKDLEQSVYQYQRNVQAFVEDNSQ